METKKCLKCRSENFPDVTYCRFCHERFARLKTFVEKAVPPLPRQGLSRRMIIAVGSILAVGAGLTFRRRSKTKKDKPMRIPE